MSQVQEGEYEVIPEANFEMKENQCYGIKIAPQETVVVKDLKKSAARNGGKGVLIALIVTIVLVAVLTLAVTAASIAFALEIYNLKAETANIHRFISADIAKKIEGLNNMLEGFSCAALPPSSPSGYYWVRASNGSAVHVYCDMTRSCGNITGGWMRVAELDMTNTSHQCPRGLMERTIPAGHTEPRTCVSTNSTPSCSHTFFNIPKISYSRLCGTIIGYQIESTNGFSTKEGIDSEYVDGVSLTHGSPRQHIWTFAAAHDTSRCPGEGPPPSYVGTNYFCDTGATTPESVTNDRFFADSPLWDCEEDSMNCDSSSPPWFYKQLPQPTTDSIEMRVCRDEPSAYEDIAIQVIEIYAQ